MQNKNQILSWFSIVVLLASCSFQQPVFKKYEGFDMGKMDTKTVSFTIKASIYNPNWYALKVKPSSLDVSTSDGKLGTLYLDEKVKMKGRKETSIEAPMHIDLEKGIMMKLMSFSLKDSVKINLKGDVRGGVFFITKKIPMEFSRSVSPKDLNPFKRN
ncbi:MAG: LEA type 2 family protein [Bacteroidota bacterium]